MIKPLPQGKAIEKGRISGFLQSALRSPSHSQKSELTSQRLRYRPPTIAAEKLSQFHYLHHREITLI
jgi:hypothetical protein